MYVCVSSRICVLFFILCSAISLFTMNKLKVNTNVILYDREIVELGLFCPLLFGSLFFETLVINSYTDACKCTDGTYTIYYFHTVHICVFVMFYFGTQL